MKIVSWNVNGLRSTLGYSPWGHEKTEAKRIEAMLSHLGGDIICFQETKLTRTELTSSLASLENYFAIYSFCDVKKGYSGVVTFVKKTWCPTAVNLGITGIYGRCDDLLTSIFPKPYLLEEFTSKELKALDSEGRCVCIGFEMENGKKLILMNFYVPNSGDSGKRFEFKMKYHALISKQVKFLKKHGCEVIVCGDINAFPERIDCAYSLEPDDMNRPHRVWFRNFLTEMKDTFREVNKNPRKYTCWDMKTAARSRNLGTRIDYILVSENIGIESASILSATTGSDHAPVCAVLKIDKSSMKFGKSCASAAEHFPEFRGKQTTLLSFFAKGKKRSLPPSRNSASQNEKLRQSRK